MATPTYLALANITLGANDTEVTFTSIPGTYRDLVLVVNGTSTASRNGYMFFNSDTTGTNYNWLRMYGQGTGSPASNSDTTTAINYDIYTSPTMIQFYIMDYSATDKHKTVLSRWDSVSNITGATAMRWENTNAITSITLDPADASFVSGATFSLYGIEA